MSPCFVILLFAGATASDETNNEDMGLLAHRKISLHFDEQFPELPPDGLGKFAGILYSCVQTDGLTPEDKSSCSRIAGNLRDMQKWQTKGSSVVAEKEEVLPFGDTEGLFAEILESCAHKPGPHGGLHEQLCRSIAQNLGEMQKRYDSQSSSQSRPLVGFEGHFASILELCAHGNEEQITQKEEKLCGRIAYNLNLLVQ